MHNPHGDAEVSKAEFARIVGVVPGRVSQWIAEKTIDGAAIVGDGRSARIHVPTAVEQLRERLDVSRRDRTAVKAKLDGIVGAPQRPVITEAELRRLSEKLSVAFLQVLMREFRIAEPDDAPPGEALR